MSAQHTNFPSSETKLFGFQELIANRRRHPWCLLKDFRKFLIGLTGMLRLKHAKIAQSLASLFRVIEERFDAEAYRDGLDEYRPG